MKQVCRKGRERGLRVWGAEYGKATRISEHCGNVYK
jgi:hypothetical protein